MKVKFNRAYDYTPTLDPRVLIVFKADGGPDKDGVYTVKRECGLAAIAAGAAAAVDAKATGNGSAEATES